MPANHADTQPLSKRIGYSINEAGVQGLFTDANVAAADTVAGLGAAIDVVNPGLHADRRFFAKPIKDAILKDQNITNANVLSLTTVAGLTALTDAGSSTRTDVLGT